ncbi:MAG TPA: hypothetical protein PLL49_05990, partial [Bacteroidales bacterium]|nr:hypothetical protein [Bacteroidales bacterium]
MEYLKIRCWFIAGNGIKKDIKNRKDFITRLSVDKKFKEIIRLGVGVSYYNGGVYQGSPNIYTFDKEGFVLKSDTAFIGKYAKREYFGVDAQFRVITPLGVTTIAGEYLMGTQPGIELESKSPNADAVTDKDTYIRNFNGGYVVLVQDMGVVPLSAVVKYDWYDPNTKVAGKQIGDLGKEDDFKKTSIGDIAYNTVG